MSDATPHFTEDVRRQIERHLDALEHTLAQSGMSRDERRSVCDDVQNHIIEMLATRAPAGANVADVEAVLAELDPPEAFGTRPAGMADSPGPVAPTPGHNESRFSRLAILGAAWAGLFLLLVPLFFLSIRTDADPSALQQILLVIGYISCAAPVATTLLGIVSISQIHHSNGRLHGMAMAVFDALFFPLLLLDGIILAAGMAGFRISIAAVTSDQHWAHLTAGGWLVSISIPWFVAVAAAMVSLDVLIIRWTWERVTGQRLGPFGFAQFFRSGAMSLTLALLGLAGTMLVGSILLMIAFQVAALVCGILTWKTRLGKAGAITAGIILGPVLLLVA